MTERNIMQTPLTILTLPTPSLRVRSVEVDPKMIGTPDFQTYLDTFVLTLVERGDGIGLASPQVGRNERVIAIKERRGVAIYINPEITKHSEKTEIGEEGCLSVPGVWGLVERAKRVSVKALDRHGRRIEIDGKGLEAIIFQHEIDHLDGVLFIDKATQITKGTPPVSSRAKSRDL